MGGVLVAAAEVGADLVTQAVLPRGRNLPNQVYSILRVLFGTNRHTEYEAELTAAYDKAKGLLGGALRTSREQSLVILADNIIILDKKYAAQRLGNGLAQFDIWQGLLKSSVSVISWNRGPFFRNLRQR